jgi:hypothetical protein
VAWVAVYVGGSRIGLVPLGNLYADRVDTLDDSDAVRLPGTGSLGRRAAQWDWHAVFGVEPYDWRFLIAPDVVAGNLQVSHDGGQTWATDAKLTHQALQGGGLLLRDRDDYHMQVTKIAFDRYHRGRIFVGTRDAGTICTYDSGQVWRTIDDSDRVGYVTGFHFYPDGAAHIASWGHGLWYLKKSTGCSKSTVKIWRRLPPVGGVGDGTIGTIARGPDEPPAPRGVADPKIAKLFLASTVPSSGVGALGPDGLLEAAGRGFPPGREVVLTIRDLGPKYKARVDERGLFATTLRLPEDYPYGSFVLEVALEGDETALATADFVKSYGDEPRERER